MRVEVVTVKGPALSRNDVDMVIAPGIRGEFAVLPSHIPFLSGLKTGVLTVRRGGRSESFAVSRGFVEVGGGDKVIVLTRRIQWFDHGETTKSGQHHHAWIFVDFERPAGRQPELIFADGPAKQQGRKPRAAEQDTLPLFGVLPSDRPA